MSEPISIDYGERVPTGIPGLDLMLHGGLLCGSAYIVQGSPGAGKTVLANQIAFHRARQGERVLYLTLLSEAHAQMFVHLRSLDFFDQSLIPDRVYYSSGYAVLEAEGMEGLVRLVIRELRRHGARFLVLDGLFVVHALADSENMFRRFVHELQGLLGMVGCTALLLTNERRDPSAAEYTMVDGWIELSAQLVDGRAVREIQIRKMRGSPFLGGRHKFRIRKPGMAVFPRLEARDRLPPVQPQDSGRRLSSGVPALDGMLRGGLPEGSATLALGPSGIGKTLLGLHFLSRATAEEPGLLFGFYESPEVLRGRAASLGLELGPLVEAGIVDLLWQPPTEMLVDEVVERLLDAVRRRGIRRLFLDGLGGFRRGFIYPERMHSFATALSNDLRGLGVTTLYSLESPYLFAMDDLRTDELSALIDNLLLLRYAMEERTLRRLLSIIKVRSSGFDPMAREFAIGAAGLEIESLPVVVPSGQGRD